MTQHSAGEAMDHVILVIFENRSLDNLLGRLYGPQDGKDFEGVIGKDLSNPVPSWAENQPPDGSGRVEYVVATDMDSPNPDSGEEWFHTNTQLFNTMDEHNRFQFAQSAPWNVPPPGTEPNMQGFVADYISFFTAQVGRQPTFDEYRHIMTGFTPEQAPVLNGLARDFGVFDHWFCEVPSQTFMNRSFWTAGTSSGGTINSPVTHWTKDNTAETLFDRLDQTGRTWKIYVREPDPVSFTAVIHWPRIGDRAATNVAPFSQFKKDAANGELPDFALIEPNLLIGHGDYHPACSRALVQGLDLTGEQPSSILAGEAFLDEIYTTYRAMRSATGANVWNTTLFIGWDEPGGTYDHVAPGPVPPPDPQAPVGQLGFTFDRSGYRVPAIVVSPWVESGSVYNDEYRHTSMLATLRKLWDLGEPFTERDKAARTFDHVFSRAEARDPDDWAAPAANPVPQYQLDFELLQRQLSPLGQAILPAVIDLAKQKGLALPAAVSEPGFELSPQLAWDVCVLAMAHYFPTLGPGPEALQKLAGELLSSLED
mgnify:CR=1 FL=1